MTDFRRIWFLKTVMANWKERPSPPKANMRQLAQTSQIGGFAGGQDHLFMLKRDDFGMNRHRALVPCLGMIFSENRFTLFRIMPWIAADGVELESLIVLNKFGPSGNGEAQVQYLDGDFRVISPGTYVRCAVTDTRIPLDELKYWSVDLQEAYALPSAVLQRHFPGALKTQG